MTSRSPSDGFATCRRCGADLAPGAAFCAVCGAPAYAAASSTRREAAPGRPWWVPAAIVVGALAAIGGGALLALALGNDNGTAADPSATPATSVAASAPAPASDGASIEPTPSPSPTPAQAAVIANRAVVEVGADPLNLRQQPNDAASILVEMPPGQRLFVIGEPTDAGDLRWYRVAVSAGPDCPEDCNLIGYVATPVLAEEEAYISEVSVECPSSPMTHDQLTALLPLEALHCFGRNDIVVTGTADTPGSGPPNAIRITPEWLGGPAPAFLRLESAGQWVVEFRADPEIQLDVPERGDVVRVVGHFEDPAATSCRAAVDPEVSGDDPVQLPDPARVILDCRATFVWTDYEVTGFEDLGPCCGTMPGSSPVGVVERRL